MTMIGRKDFITSNIGQCKPPKQIEHEIHYFVIGDFVGEEGRNTTVKFGVHRSMQILVM